MTYVRRCLIPLCVFGALTAIGAVPAWAGPPTAHMAGTLSVTISGTSPNEPCPSAFSTATESFAGSAQINDTVQSYKPTDQSVLSLSGNWSTDYCSGSASGQASGSVTGFATDPTVRGTVVDWGRDVTHPGQYALSMQFYAPGTVTQSGDTGGCSDGYPTTEADFGVGINFPEPAGGFGTSHIDKTLTYGNPGGDTEGDTWTGGPSPCSGVSVSDVTVHITGDITVSQVSGGNGNGNAAGTASGRSSSRASSNGTVTVGSSSCAGPGACTDNTTVTNGASGSHAIRKVTYGHAKVTVAAGKTVKLNVKLTKKALKALKKAGKLKTTVTVVITSPGKTKVTKHFKLTIKAPKK